MNSRKASKCDKFMMLAFDKNKYEYSTKNLYWKSF